MEEPGDASQSWQTNARPYAQVPYFQTSASIASLSPADFTDIISFIAVLTSAYVRSKSSSENSSFKRIELMTLRSILDREF